MKTTELVSLLSSKTSFELPELLFEHFTFCSVQVNDTVLLLIGGALDTDYKYISTEITNKTYFLDMKTSRITYGPTLNHARSSHGCGLVLVQDKPVIFVTGGTRDIGTINFPSTEYLELTNINLGWKEGK